MSIMADELLSVVIPCFNEEGVVRECYRRVNAALAGIPNHELIFVNDGSRDKTLVLLKELHSEDSRVKVLSFSANRGHQIAVTAGLDAASGDAVCIIDADLQDPPELIPKMLDKIREGYDVVYGKRVSREGDSAFKKASAWGFYRLLNMLTSTAIPEDTGDFRMITKRAADAVRGMREHNRFLRGMFAWIGFRQTAIEFERGKRFAGETKYPLRQMLKLAGNGIYSFSLKPISWIWKIGIAICACSLLWLIVSLVLLLFGIGNGTAAGFALLQFTNGLIITALGVVGVYVGRTYQEAQARPLYYIDEIIGIKDRNTTHNES